MNVSSKAVADVGGGEKGKEDTAQSGAGEQPVIPGRLNGSAETTVQSIPGHRLVLKSKGLEEVTAQSGAGYENQPVVKSNVLPLPESPKKAVAEVAARSGVEDRLVDMSNVMSLPDRFKKGVAETPAQPGAEEQPAVKSNVLPLLDSPKKAVAETAAKSGTEDRPMVKSNDFSLPDRFKKGVDRKSVV